MIDLGVAGAASDPDPASIASLAAGIGGEVLEPGQPGYEEARRIWNGMIDRRPRLIVRCRGTDDIRTSLAFAMDHGLRVSVRGGGHNVAGIALVDGGLTIDLSPLRAVQVDPARRVVTVDAGATLGDLDAATQPFGLAVPAGVVPTTGVAGLTLGGGIGWLMRRHGLTGDHLRAADVLTADRRIVRASEDENDDLLWGLRGGGGNLGIVTRFEFDAVPVGPDIVGGVVLYGLDEAGEVLRRYRTWADGSPDDVTTILTLRTVLPLPAFPPELHGRRVLSVGAAHSGPIDDGERLVAPLRALGQPLLDRMGRMPFLTLQRLFEPSVPWGNRYYWKSESVATLSDPLIERLVEHAGNAAQPWSYTIIFQLGGAIARVAPDATAYADRAAGFAINVNGVGVTPDEDEATVAWTRAHWEDLRPHSTGGVYVNFLMDEGEARVRAAYGAAYDRLAALKARWDPGNVFRVNQNVAPGGR